MVQVAATSVRDLPSPLRGEGSAACERSELAKLGEGCDLSTLPYDLSTPPRFTPHPALRATFSPEGRRDGGD